MTKSLAAEPHAKRVGSQRPSFLRKPAGDASDIWDAEDAIDLAAAFGLIADEWQEGVVTGISARGADGLLAAKRAGLSVPRQNGKNGGLEVIELGQMVLLGRRILHSAHEVKALDVETPILAERGWTTMGDLVTGDRVYGPDGKLTNVIAHPFRYGRPCYRITFDDGQEIVADEDHLWGVTFVSTWGKKTYQVVNTRQIAEHGVSTETPRVVGRNRKTYHWRVQLPEPLAMPAADLPVDPWVLGAWIGDGTSSNGTITEGADDAAYFRTRLERCGYHVTEYRDRRTGAVSLCAHGLTKQLRQLGVLGAKRIPEEYLLGSVTQRRALLAGIFDSDGTSANGQCQVGSINEDLSRQYLQLARSLGYKATWREARAVLDGRDCGPFYVVQFRASQADSPFELGRKTDVLPPRRHKGSRSSYNAIVGIEPAESRPTRCITVDNDSRLYCVGRGFVPTHNTGRKAFIRLASFFEEHDELRAMVKTIRKVNGQEAILLHNGGSCEFIARSKSSGRGYSVDTLVLDEAQELRDEALEALLPTISSGPAGDPQIIMTGTPPDPTDVNGEVFRRMHDEAHEGTDSTLWWAEWSVLTPDDGAAIDADDENLWYQANPALGTRMDIETIRAERASMADASFRRERLGMWEQERTARVLPLEDWMACADPNLIDDGDPVALAIDIAPGRDSASIAACGMTVDGHVWVDVIENRRGSPEWVAPRLKAILEKQEVRAVMIDVLSPAGSLIDPLEAEGIKISKTGSHIMAAATAQFYDAVMSHDLRHVDQVHLNLAAAAARKRKLGDAWAWNRANADADITPLVAATLAYTGRTYTKAKRPVRPVRPKRKVVVW